MLPWEEVKSKTDIIEVLGQYIALKSKGANYSANCPFHQETTPSFIVSPSKQIWHCFGCGMGGDVFGFVAEIENTDKITALKELALKVNVEIPDYKKNLSQVEQIESQNQISEYEQGLKVLDWSSQIYHQILLKYLENPDHEITKYCHSRGLTIEIIKKFKLGYAPNNNQTLIKFAEKYNIDSDWLLKTSLVKKKG
jgi:DNA primase